MPRATTRRLIRSAPDGVFVSRGCTLGLGGVPSAGVLGSTTMFVAAAPAPDVTRAPLPRSRGTSSARVSVRQMAKLPRSKAVMLTIPKIQLAAFMGEVLLTCEPLFASDAPRRKTRTIPYQPGADVRR